MSQLDEALAIIRKAGDNPNLPVPSKWNKEYQLLKYQRVAVSHLITKTRFVLGDPCLTGDTPILTKEGIIPLEQLEANQPFLSERGIATSQGLICRGEHLVYKVRTSNGGTFRATPDHLVEIWNGERVWKKVRDLLPGDYLISRRGNGGLIPGDRGLDPRVWLVLGWLYGDGYRNYIGNRKYLTWQFNESEHDLRAKYLEILVSLGVENLTLLEENISPSSESVRHKKKLLIRGTSNFLETFLPTYQRESRWKDGFPIRIWGEGLAQQRAFIKGLWSSDRPSTKGGNKNSFSTKWPKLARDNRSLLLYHGILVKTEEGWEDPQNEVYFYRQSLLGLQSQRRFLDNIKYEQNYKNEALSEGLVALSKARGTTKLGVPLAKFWANQVLPRDLKIDPHHQSCGVQILSEAKKDGRFLPDELIPEILEYLDEQGIENKGFLQEYQDFEYFLDPVTSVNPDGEAIVYDVKESTSSTFIAAHITHHNCGTGKTPTELYSWAVMADNRPLRLMVLTTKSATYQWGDEVEKFLPGVPYFVVPSLTVRGTQATKIDRIETYQKWIAAGPGSVVILNWNQMVNDWEDWLQISQDQWINHTQLCLDEAQRIKNPETKLHQTVIQLLKSVPRAHGLTATLVKNKAHDAYAIVNAFVPNFMSLDYFNTRYCVWEKRSIRIKTKTGRGRKARTNALKEYRLLDEFANTLSPYYLARTDEELEQQRPEIVHVTRKALMSPEHRKVYLDAERGLFLASPTQKPEEVAGPALIHAQLAANNPELFPGKKQGLEDLSTHPDYPRLQKANSKLNLLKELLEIELVQEPVVIYTHLETSVTAIHKALEEFNPVRITGKEADEARAEARKAFMSGKTNIIIITDAGGEALNLQRAKHLIFYSRPMDPGRYVQIVGRIRRFGLDSKHVVLWHLTMIDSVDEWVDALLVNKFGPFDTIVRGRAGMMPTNESLPLELVKIARRKRIRGGA